MTVPVADVTLTRVLLDRYLINNQFKDPKLTIWSRAAVVLLGQGTNSSKQVVLVDTPASEIPHSQLLFGGDW